MGGLKLAKLKEEINKKERELSTILAQTSGVMLTIIVMLRIALYEDFPANYAMYLGFAMIFIAITLAFSLINFKIEKQETNKILNLLAIIFLLIGVVILITIITIAPST